MLDHIKGVWRDPVWSKIIAAGILATLGTIYALLKSRSALAFVAALGHALTTCVPCWVFLITLVVIVLLVPYWWRATRAKKPEIFMAWDGSAGWGIGGLLQKEGVEPVLTIQGRAVITSSHLEDPILVTGVELQNGEYAAPNFQIFEVKPRETTRHSLLFNFRGVKPEKERAFTANLTLVDIKGNRYPLKPVALRAFPGSNAFSIVPPPATLPASDSLLIDTPDKFSIRITKFDSAGIRGIQLQIENDRPTSIHKTRVILSSATSWDSRNETYREPSLTARTFNRPDAIGPSSSGKPIPLVWKVAHSTNLVTGENNIHYPLVWPERDKAAVQRWKLSIRAQTFIQPKNSQEQSTPLKELFTEIILFWDSTRNEFSIEMPVTAIGPPSLPEAFPLDGKDGAHREIARYIMCGPDQLLAYKTTRKGLSGTRFLVVRMRPNGDPQSVETPDRENANSKWSEWYQEWKQRGFGGASGNGIDGMPPF